MGQDPEMGGPKTEKSPRFWARNEHVWKASVDKLARLHFDIFCFTDDDTWFVDIRRNTRQNKFD